MCRVPEFEGVGGQDPGLSLKDNKGSRAGKSRETMRRDPGRETETETRRWKGRLK